jgi:hypothetical protein
MAVLTHAYRKAIAAPGIAGALMPLLSALGHLRGDRPALPEPTS